MNSRPPDRALFIQAAERLGTWRRPVLFSHSKPDGDALGSMLGLSRLLAGRGADARAVLFEPLPDRFKTLDGFGSLIRLGEEFPESGLDAADGIVILDTCTYNQLEPVSDWLRRTRLPKFVIDHHITRDSLADVYLVDESAAATCLILFDWAKAAGWTIDADTASALFVGLATDTGWFRHSNTNGRTLEAAGELAILGARPNDLFQQLYLRDSVGRVRLLAAALDSLNLLSENRLAVMRLPFSAFARTGASPADTEDIVNEPLRIESVVVSVLLVEQDNGPIRVNLRSKAPAHRFVPDVDVAAVAQAFDGGGHRRAAGARVTGTMAEVHQRVIGGVLSALPPSIECPG